MKRAAKYNDHKIELTDGIDQPLRRGDKLVFPNGAECEVVYPPQSCSGLVEFPRSNVYAHADGSVTTITHYPPNYR